jgi:SAM-dependent methyltransferase
MVWDLVCPSCRVALVRVDSDGQRCSACGVVYRRQDGVWRLLGEGRQDAFRAFVDQYEAVRTGEGRVVRDADQLKALPFRDLSRKRSYEWHIRARSFEALIDRVVRPLERRSKASVRVIDMGSGLGWLAYRLALRGHRVAAVDLVTNDFDGLGAHVRYGCEFTTIQAEFDRLPVQDACVDLVVYNAAFHYAADYRITLKEALRVLAPGGRLVILDTPVYRDPSSGARMVREREEAFAERYGFRGSKTEGFLTYDRLAKLGSELGLRWELIRPWYGFRWWMKPWVARLRGRREPAQFMLVVGCRARARAG